MIGIKFQLKNEYSDFLAQIFDGIDVGKFAWVIAYEEILYQDEHRRLKNSFFGCDLMDGPGFCKRIKEKTYYMLFADLKAFSDRAQVTEIETYEDFASSSCEIALFCDDAVYVDLYCKSEAMLNRIVENCELFGFGDLERIMTRDEDGRTRFSVW